MEPFMTSYLSWTTSLKSIQLFSPSKDWYGFIWTFCSSSAKLRLQPFYAGTWIVYLLTTNLGLGATFSHLLIWNRDDMRKAWAWLSPSELRKMRKAFNWRFWQDDGMREDQYNAENLDPHYREMLKVGFNDPKIWFSFANCPLFPVTVS
jgi:hypothetical protein